MAMVILRTTLLLVLLLPLLAQYLCRLDLVFHRFHICIVKEIILYIWAIALSLFICVKIYNNRVLVYLYLYYHHFFHSLARIITDRR